MESSTKLNWRMAGEEVASCNCAWGCPCQFNALPTTGHCEAVIGYEIRAGEYGATRLDGLRFAQIVRWPGAIHEGNGTRQWIIDEQASPEQREALAAIQSGKEGGTYFEIMASVCPYTLDPAFAAIELRVDRERRTGALRISGLAECDIESIKNPVTGEEHRARIELPNGFEYKKAEMASVARLEVTAPEPLVMRHKNTYAQLNEFDWSNA
jgi:hypothetical protein